MSHDSTAQSLTPLPVGMLLQAGTRSEMNAASTASFRAAARPAPAAGSFQPKQETRSVQLIVEPRPAGIKEIPTCSTGILKFVFFFSLIVNYERELVDAHCSLTKGS